MQPCVFSLFATDVDDEYWDRLSNQIIANKLPAKYFLLHLTTALQQ